MKKVTVILALALVAVLALGSVGYAYAQSGTPQAPANGQGGRGSGRGMGGGYGQGMRGELRGTGDGYLHDYMVAAFASELGIAEDVLESRLADGETMAEIAQTEGYDLEGFRELMLSARETAISSAVADGVITDAQGDWMLDRMNRMSTYGYGPGSGRGNGACQGIWADQ